METQVYSVEEQQNLKTDAANYILTHFANQESIEKTPKIFTRGEGCYVYDIEGKKYFDSFATLLTTICGHNRPEVTEAVNKQMNMLEFFPNYVDAFTVPLVDLARKIAQIMPGGLEVSFFVNSGSEANETALKIVRQYHVENGEAKRYKFIARRDSYHATTLGGTAVTGLKWFKEYFEPLTPGALFVSAARKRDCPSNMTEKEYTDFLLKEIETTIEYEGASSIAGMIIDPLPGSNTGYPLPPEGYLEGVRKICDKYGILLIFDEVQTGFGKTGKWFFCEHLNVYPDVMTLGKGLTGGFIPLGIAVTTQKVAEKFRKPGHELRSGSTYGGHTVACAATIANIGIVEKENLVGNAEKMGALLVEKLMEIRKKHSIISLISGVGLLQSVFINTPSADSAKVGSWIREWCYKNGMILRNNGSILVLAPSLIITEAEVAMMVDKIDQALTAAEKEFGL